MRTHLRTLTLALAFSLITFAGGAAGAQELPTAEATVELEVREVLLPEAPGLRLAQPELLSANVAPKRGYAWPLATMGVGVATSFLGGALYSLSAGIDLCGAFSPGAECPPRSREGGYLVITGVGTALFAAGLTWLAVRTRQYRRARRALAGRASPQAW